MRAIGIDLGTTGLCALMLDGETGAVLDTAHADNAFLPGRPWERLQDPAAILRRARELMEQLTRRRGRAAAVGVTGQMHGMLYVDGRGRALGPLYTWQDGRGSLPAPGGGTWAEWLSRRTGRALATGYGAVTHAYNLHNGLVPPEARGIVTLPGYIAMALCGRAAPLLHASDAAGLGLWNPCGWDGQALAGAGLDAACFPAVTAETEILGQTPDGAVVAVALGDNQAGFLGAVRGFEGGVLVNVGTGSQISVFSPELLPAGGLEARPCPGGGWLLVGAPLCGGRAYALLHRFLQEAAALAGCPADSLYEAMNREALSWRSLSDRLVVDTRFAGTRAEPGLRGAIHNLGEENFTVRHLIAGVLEGMARELYDLYAGLGQAAPPAALAGAGNGLRRNPALREMLSDLFGQRLRMPIHSEEAAFGAALFALTAAGHFPSLQDARRLIRYEDEAEEQG